MGCADQRTAGFGRLPVVTLEIPAAFASDITDRHDSAGRAWLRRLPHVVDELCGRWQLAPEGATWFGYCAIALPVRRADDTPAVLKVSWPGPDQAPEGPTLRAWDGDGAVRPLAHGEDRWALLLERLDESRDLTGVPIGEAIEVIGSLLRRMHRATVPTDVPSLADTARRWAEEIPSRWPVAAPPWPDRVRDEAVATCRELGDADGGQLLHADLHFENVLAADREPWLAIDPKGLVGDPAFESSPVLWNRFDEYSGQRDVRRRLDAWCEAADIDRDRARAWARVRMVEDAIDQLVGASGGERDIAAHRYLIDALPT
jgi:streptomycin 6-kinase